MDREKIERLAIDSQSGQLNEDTEELLQQYLAEHQEANKWFIDMQEIYNLTQTAFDTKTASIKEQTENTLALKFNWFPIMRLVAVIVIAACIGIFAGRWSKPTTTLQKPPSIIASSNSVTKQSHVTLDDFINNLDDGFWRDKVMAMLNPPTKIHREKSPGPSLLEQYRYYIKERNYE